MENTPKLFPRAEKATDHREGGGKGKNFCKAFNPVELRSFRTRPMRSVLRHSNAKMGSPFRPERGGIEGALLEGGGY